MTEQIPEWISLSDARLWLISRNSFLDIGDTVATMLTAAIRDKVPVRGIPYGKHCTASIPIKGQDAHDLDMLCILRNTLQAGISNYYDVMVDKHACEQFARTTWPEYFRSEILPDAPPAVIKREIKAVYDEAEAAGTKPPNINQLPDAVLPRLQAKGYTASKAQIKKIGKQSEERRRPRGPTMRSEKQREV
jgi:hypothetical protein